MAGIASDIPDVGRWPWPAGMVALIHTIAAAAVAKYISGARPPAARLARVTNHPVEKVKATTHTPAGTPAPHGQIITIIDPPIRVCSVSETRSQTAGRSRRAPWNPVATANASVSDHRKDSRPIIVGTASRAVIRSS